MTTLIIQFTIGEEILNFSFPNNDKGQKAAEKKVKEVINDVYNSAAHKYTKKLRQLSKNNSYWIESKSFSKLESEESDYLQKHNLTKPSIKYSAYVI